MRNAANCLCFLSLDSHGNVWRQISRISSDGSLTPEYKEIEELFAQQTKKKATTDQKAKKAPKDVSIQHNGYLDL